MFIIPSGYKENFSIFTRTFPKVKQFIDVDFQESGNFISLSNLESINDVFFYTSFSN